VAHSGARSLRRLGVLDAGCLSLATADEVGRLATGDGYGAHDRKRFMAAIGEVGNLVIRMASP